MHFQLYKEDVLECMRAELELNTVVFALYAVQVMVCMKKLSNIQFMDCFLKIIGVYLRKII